MHPNKCKWSLDQETCQFACHVNCTRFASKFSPDNKVHPVNCWQSNFSFSNFTSWELITNGFKLSTPPPKNYDDRERITNESELPGSGPEIKSTLTRKKVSHAFFSKWFFFLGYTRPPLSSEPKFSFASIFFCVQVWKMRNVWCASFITAMSD